jgi:hypothetical protein
MKVKKTRMKSPIRLQYCGVPEEIVTIQANADVWDSQRNSTSYHQSSTKRDGSNAASRSINSVTILLWERKEQGLWSRFGQFH